MMITAPMATYADVRYSTFSLCSKCIKLSVLHNKIYQVEVYFKRENEP